MTSIYETQDYRDFLRERFWELKAEGRKVSYQQFAKKHGTSLSYLKLITLKKRHLSHDKITAVSAYFELDEIEKNYLTFSILKSQATEPNIRSYFEAVLFNLRFRHQSSKNCQPNLDANQSRALFGRILAMTIEQLLDLPDYQHDAEWIKKRLSTSNTVEEIATEMKFLESLGVIVNTPQGWRRKTVTWQHIPSPFSHEDYKAFGAGVIEAFNATQDVKKFAPGTYHMNVSTLSMAQYEEISEMLDKVNDKIYALAKEPSDNKEVYLFNSSLFRLTK